MEQSYILNVIGALLVGAFIPIANPKIGLLRVVISCLILMSGLVLMIHK